MNITVNGYCGERGFDEEEGAPQFYDLSARVGPTTDYIVHAMAAEMFLSGETRYRIEMARPTENRFLMA